MWKDIGKEIVMVVLDFFEQGIIPSSLNNTIISLIPKVENLTKAVEDRPIAYYLIKGYNKKNNSPRCAMKIDLSKTYDTIDRGFLEDLMNVLCFPSRFIKWVMVCLRGTTYSLMMNGRIQVQFKGEKELRQGDPISPLLFVIVMDYLTRLLLKASSNKAFSTLGSVQIIQGAFDAFCAASGLAANGNKSNIFFRGLRDDEKDKILDCTKIEEGSFPLKHLGVPLRPTKWKATDCDPTVKKIHVRLHSWSSRLLSFVGRAQLIHLVLLGLRSYWMNIFLLPQSVAKEIDRLCKIFLWGERGSQSKFHLTPCKQVCLSNTLDNQGRYTV
ncbi:uncharacterized protein LOC133821761 [Humulus lupulus]|uniref:uncharacterized protein LOC133821761 n=1 Tax=Humulus lupulus TaxID=3486 RepID=UPI002B415DF4|nr:uncharacterized protein LOC133821761 [Humulus lupulus]